MYFIIQRFNFVLKIGADSFSKIVGPFIVYIFGILLMLDFIVLYIATVHNSVEFAKIHGANLC